MESKAKILGHPIHPMLIVFPLGLFVSAILFDIIYLATGNQVFAAVAFYNIAGGIIGGVVAAIFGFWDYFAIPKGTRAKRIGTFHGFGNLAVVMLFSISWLFRLTSPQYEPPLIAMAFSFLAGALGLGTAWLGGELVNRLGVGVDPGANLNAPSSLTQEPAGHSVELTQVPVTGKEKEGDQP